MHEVSDLSYGIELRYDHQMTICCLQLRPEVFRSWNFLSLLEFSIADSFIFFVTDLYG